MSGPEPRKDRRVDCMSRELGETDDCSVKALALILNISYETAHAALEARGHQYRDGTPRSMLRKALTDLGFEVRREWNDPRRLALELGLDGQGRLLISQAQGNPGVWDALLGRALVFVPQHVAALVGGRILDWTSDRRAPVQSVWEVRQRGGGLRRGVEPPPVIHL